MIAALMLSFMLSGGTPATGAPSSFTVINGDGEVVAGATLLAGDRHAVVYVAPGLEPAARLVDALRKWAQDDPRWKTSIVLVVAAPVEQARSWLREHWGDDALPTWVADADAQGWRAFGFEGSVGVAGVENGTVDWKLDGVIADPSVVEPSLRAWTGIGAP